MTAKKKLIEITDQEIERIYDSGKEATVAFIKVIISKLNDLAEVVEKQQQEIEELKARINKDSHNSNKPPSTDDPFKKKTKSLRKKGGKAGGQKGHKGTNLKRNENPDRIEPLKVTGDCQCGREKTAGEHAGYEIRQVVDLPEIKMKVTDFQAEILKCECGEVHTAEFPPEVTSKVQYGTNIKSLIVYLKHYGFMSYERIAEFIEDVAGQKISQGTLVNMINECASKLNPVVEKIRETLTEEPVVHFDETGIRIDASLHWLHIAGNDKYTVYLPHKRRGKPAMDEMNILPHFRGIAVHDHWDSYYKYQQCLHSLCNAHHLRELNFFEEQGGKWAIKIKRCLLNAKEEKDNNPDLGEERRRFYRSKMQRLINEGLKIHPKRKKTIKKRGRPKQSKAHNLLFRMKKSLDDVLRFTHIVKVPFDNNQGERDARMAKVQQKVSGAFRSLEGAISFSIIRSYMSTARKQGLSVYEAIVAGLKNRMIIGINCTE